MPECTHCDSKDGLNNIDIQNHVAMITATLSVVYFISTGRTKVCEREINYCYSTIRCNHGGTGWECIKWSPWSKLIHICNMCLTPHVQWLKFTYLLLQRISLFFRRGKAKLLLGSRNSSYICKTASLYMEGIFNPLEPMLSYNVLNLSQNIALLSLWPENMILYFHKLSHNSS